MLPSLSIQNDAFEAEILFQGAQLMHFAPRGERGWIFRSPNTPYTPQREIYGGVPVIFPWFGRLEGQPDAPNHAWVRQANWKLEEQSETRVTLSLNADEVRAQGIDTTLWPYDFIARMSFEFGDALGMRLEIINESAEEVRFECALHTYFAVENLQATRVEGLDGEPFRFGGKGDLQTQRGAIAFGEPVTQVFATSGGPLQIHDQNRTYTLTPREGWASTIVWNPAKAMADLSDEDARSFVCVEAGAIREGAPTIAPGQSYALDINIQG